MALQTNELYNERDFPQSIRMVVKDNTVADLAAGTALLPIGTPMAKNSSTGFWVPFTQGGSNGTNVVRAFIAHATVQLKAGGEVKGVLMLTGEIHRDDVNTAAIRAVLGGGPTEGNVDTVLSADGLRDAGIIVRGIANIPG